LSFHGREGQPYKSLLGIFGIEVKENRKWRRAL